jgi:hypothetical protein
MTRFVQTTYDNALRFNSILWNTYIAEIIDISKVPEFTSALQYAFNQANIILTPEQQTYLDSLLNLEFFQLNFSDSMIFAYRLQQILINIGQIVFKDGTEIRFEKIQGCLFMFTYAPGQGENIFQIPNLAQLGAIQYNKGFNSDMYSWLEVLTIPENNTVRILVDWLVERSEGDPIISQEDRDFIHSLLNIGG